MCSTLLAGALVGLAAAEAGAAGGTSVTNVSVSATSTAVGAAANWTVGFTTSTTGALPYPGSTVTVTLPSSAGLTSFNGGKATDVTTGNQVSSNCENTTGTTVVCNLNYGYAVNAGDVISVLLYSVTNPTATGSANLTVATSADTKAVTKSLTLTTAQSVSGLSVALGSKAAGATTDWTIGLTASSSGALVYPGSTLTVTLPTGTTFGAYQGGSVTDITTGNQVGDDCDNSTGTVMVCGLDYGYGYNTNAGDVLSIQLTDVTNPTTTGSVSATVSTSSDSSTATKSVTLSVAAAVSGLSLAQTSTAVGATGNWTIGFTTSTTGAMPYPGASVTVVLPAGTTFGAYQGGTVTDTTTGDPESSNCENSTGTTMVCNLNYGYGVNAGDVLSVLLNDVTNPSATGSANTTVTTSADTKAATKATVFTAAQAVSGVSVSPASTASGATTDWTLGFTTSSTGALAYPGSTVTIALPSGTTFGSYGGGTVTDTTTGNAVSDCDPTTGTTVVCTLDYGYSDNVNAGDQLSILLDDVTNPTTTGAVSTTVSTSSDTKTATKSTTLTAAGAVSGLSVSPTSTAAGATGNWTVGFTTSSSGALPYPGSSITLTLPAGTTFGAYQGGTVTDTTTGNPVSNNCTTSTGTTMVCTLNYGYNVNAGDVLSVVLNDVTNPSATGSATTAVSTSSDQSPANAVFTVTTAQAVTNVSVSLASTAVGATTDWTVGFTTSSTGALVYPGSTVTIALPTGTTFGSYEGGVVTDTTTGNPVSDDCDTSTGTTMVCTLDYGYENNVNAGDQLSVVLEDVTNPNSTGSVNTTVSTSSDSKTVTKSVTLAAAKSVSNLSVAQTSTAVGATGNWTVGFTASSSGALPYPGSSITLTLPAGATFGAYQGGTVTDTTTGNTESDNCNNSTGTTMVCTLNYGYGVNPGDVLSVVLNDVTNPGATGSANTTVTTSADTKAATKATVFTAAQAVTALTVSPTSTAAGATTNWTVGFTTSSTGALAYPGTSVTIGLPSGTTFGTYEGGTVTDSTTGYIVSDDCNPTGTTMVCTLDYGYGNSVNAGDQVSVVLDDVTNPTSTGSAATTVSTSSDTQSASQSVNFSTGQGISNVSLAPTSTAAGAAGNWTVGFTTSSTGALDYPGGTITLALPAGVGLASFDGGVVTDTTSGNTVSDDCGNSGTTITCTLNYGINVNAGDSVSVVLEDVVNPASTGSAPVAVSTSADTTPADAAFTVTTAQAVSNLTVVPTATGGGATTNWTIGFTASSTGALAYPGSTVTIVLPSGTTFGSFGGGTIMDTTSDSLVSDDCDRSSGTTVTCALDYGIATAAGDTLSVLLDDVTNPVSAGSANTTVSTSSDTQPTSVSVTFTTPPGPECAKVSGKISGSVTLASCTPTSTAYASATGLGSALTAGGTFTWSTSAKTTVVHDTVSSPGQGSCAAGSIERDISGSVTGGTAKKKYTPIGDVVLVHLCQNSKGKLKLVTGTKAIF